MHVLSSFFPRDERFFPSRAGENGASRVWPGIHARTASEVGAALGRRGGGTVIEQATQGGAA